MNITSRYNNDLYHYGVVGMKWGIRRAQKRGQTYNYRSYGQKQYEKKLAKQTAKGASADKIAKTSAKLETFKTRDKARQKYAESTTVGSAIARGMLLGPFGTGHYNRLRASGVGIGESAIGAVLGNYVGGIIAVPVTKAIENDNARKKNRRS